MEPFASKKRSWNTLLLNPFMHSNSRASIAVAKLMHRVMIRNRREDITKDVTLPELNKKLVFLDFDYYQWMVSKGVRVNLGHTSPVLNLLSI
jgi:hypothetical protein